MKTMLMELRTETNNKYNVTDYDFESFVRRATTAVSASNKLDWTFLNGLEFVFAALTTIGKKSQFK